jgi:hypothetical protein
MKASLLYPLLWPRRLEGDVTDASLRVYPVLGWTTTLLVVTGLGLLVLWAYRGASISLSPAIVACSD